MLKKLKGKDKLVQFLLVITMCVGLYLFAGWISYSPLDSAWSVSDNITSQILNKTGIIGAWSIDLLFSTFGMTAIFIPLALILSPLYWLSCNLTTQLHWGYVVVKSVYFSLFLMGLAIICHILFGYSEYYAVGGFVGGIATSIISNYIGILGALVISIFLIVVGFYLCFGNVFLVLAEQFFAWVMTTEEQNKSHSPILETESSITPSFLAKEQTQPVSQEEEVENQAENTESSLIDVTQFTRPVPKITRANKDEERQEEIEQQQEIESELNPFEHLHHIKPASQLKVETASVEVEDNSLIDEISQPIIPQPQAVEFSSQFANEDLPQVHLELDDEVSERIDVILQDEPSEVESVSVVSQKEQEPKVEKGNVNPYPKGYGDTLIHPLLQQHTKMPKPTTPLPTLNLMEVPPEETQMITDREITETSERIEQALADFGVKATVEDVLVGPVVTRYEIQLAPGVKSSKVINIGSDLARALMFKAIRITEVVPGKPYMGIETPNSYRETVWLRDIFASKEFAHSTAKLPMALGKDISGQSVVVDMAKMPHLLVAGQTGGGKSVGVNTMILSLLYKLTPEQVRFIMIDPKVVELSIYDNIPHLLTPVVTDMKKAVNSLRWVVDEMERRYMLLKHLSVRNIEGYNDKIKQAEEMQLPIPDPSWKQGDTMDLMPPPLKNLSYIVVIIDEFSDLIMTQGKQVEEYIIRIGQKARAAGIHLILATQRPSADVITGLIKSNIPSRIAFTVASQIDSRTILDKGGAESLLGRGDMLYSAAGTPDIIRIHGAFMTDNDVQQVTDNWRARAKPNYIEAIVASSENGEEQASSSSDGGDLDPLFDEVVAFVVDSGVTSASGVQRKFSIGFPRAARILDQLQEQGILSTPDHRGKREIVAQ
ncbi:DNA translocase FtsK [Phocoenobacter uteri]|uniref:DNA translocase FtsK n=1 Tax=Phocoenobacter uteri TaxID=146806 RepID=A0A379C9Y9_9PAST|nr:DNA translocase FtsK [Phocoenobacter uteri]MDG6881180.1 cell division protein FtsK [Phocoenobacter uteri]SUB59202.1 DNA translocase FtsK [Phocoenobacter uteri]